MISLFKYVYNFFNTDIKQLQTELDEKLKQLEDEEKLERDQNAIFQPDKVSDVVGLKYYKKIGIVTSMEANNVVIDKTLIVDILAVTPSISQLQVGSKVEYLAYDAGEQVRVVKVLQVLQECWDDNPSELFIESQLSTLKQETVEYFNTHERSILGFIVHRNANFITVETDYDKLDVDLDEVNLEFLPQLGDCVYLTCKVQTDQSFVDSAGEILEVLKIFPARKINIDEKITKLFEDSGIIGNKYFFSLDILPPTYTPNEGDLVRADAIECSRGKFDWRCIQIVPIQTIPFPIKHLPAQNKELFFSDKDGLVLTNISFEFDHIYEVSIKEIVVKNESWKPKTIIKCVFLGKKFKSQLKVLEPNMFEPFILNPGESRNYKIEAKSKFYGQSTEVLLFKFAECKIAKEIEISVGQNKENVQGFEYKKSAKHNEFYANQVWSRKAITVPGINPFKKPKFVANRIGHYEVPEMLRKVWLTSINNTEKVKNVENMFLSLSEPLSYLNYTYRFQTLLHLEEIDYFVSMRQYDRERAHFNREDEYLSLQIENLSEKRPSLIVSDTILATNPWAENGDNRSYQGVIHKILFDRILLKFNMGFQSEYNGEDYRIEFFYSRGGFRKQHYAVKKAVNNLGPEILFPTKLKLNNKLQLNVTLDEDYNLITEHSNSIKWFNPNLNNVQKIAIKNVLRGEARPMPYVIFGPPGTGKTMTLVETILQIVTLLPYSRLLVGTPSNSSADLITSRLIECDALQPGDFVRLVSHNLVERDLIPDHLKPYCATTSIAAQGSTKDEMIITDSGLKLRCQAHNLGRHRITISTSSTLGSLLFMAFPKEHFTHVLIDEAGQCSEPEVMVALTQIDCSVGQVVLAGDPLQLGPVVLNRYASDKGLSISYLERILDTVLYTQDSERFLETGYDPRLVTKLIYNYRSLPSVLKIYNDLFYKSSLRAKIDPLLSKDAEFLKSIQNILPSSETRLVNHGVFFIGVRGENLQDSDSPSWYNAAEAKNIFLFVIKLYKQEISPKSIGIIAPYQKQVKILRAIFNEADLILPKIGSVEEFQGQERDIIIISTVRSKKSLLHIDVNHALGFVRSSKRMNVALSRARSVLIVFGNPHLLCFDPSWEKFIRYCIDNNSYSGCDLPAQLNQSLDNVDKNNSL